MVAIVITSFVCGFVTAGLIAFIKYLIYIGETKPITIYHDYYDRGARKKDDNYITSAVGNIRVTKNESSAEVRQVGTVKEIHY